MILLCYASRILFLELRRNKTEQPMTSGLLHYKESQQLYKDWLKITIKELQRE